MKALLACLVMALALSGCVGALPPAVQYVPVMPAEITLPLRPTLALAALGEQSDMATAIKAYVATVHQLSSYALELETLIGANNGAKINEK